MADTHSLTRPDRGRKDVLMPRSSPQAQVALISALIFLLVGFALVAVLVTGVAGGGLTAAAPLLLGALALGVFALSARLFMLARRPRTAGRAAPPASAEASPAARATDRPRPSPKGRVAG